MNIKCRGRLSFPALWKAKSFEGEGGKQTEPKYGATVILDKVKDKAVIKQIKAAVEQIANDHFKGKIPGSLKRPVRDGSEKDHLDGYGDQVMFISMSCKKRPVVVDRDLSPLTEEDDKIYAGCYCMFSGRLWVQDNKWGKRVNVQLRAIQFAKDGDPFGEEPVNPEEEFEALEDDGSDDDDDLLD